MKLHMLTFLLLAIGGLNWLLVGLGGFAGADWNIVHMILGTMPQIEWIVYILVGASAVYELAMHKQNCKECAMK